MRRRKAPERLCCYAASVAKGTHSESSSSVREVDQRGWRDAVRSEEQQTDVAVSQEVTSGSWRSKQLQNPLREAKEDVDPKRIMRRGKVPERLCCYVAAIARGTHSESSSSVRVVDQRG